LLCAQAENTAHLRALSIFLQSHPDSTVLHVSEHQPKYKHFLLQSARETRLYENNLGTENGHRKTGSVNTRFCVVVDGFYVTFCY